MEKINRSTGSREEELQKQELEKADGGFGHLEPSGPLEPNPGYSDFSSPLVTPEQIPVFPFPKSEP